MARKIKVELTLRQLLDIESTLLHSQALHHFEGNQVNEIYDDVEELISDVKKLIHDYQFPEEVSE